MGPITQNGNKKPAKETTNIPQNPMDEWKNLKNK